MTGMSDQGFEAKHPRGGAVNRGRFTAKEAVKPVGRLGVSTPAPVPVVPAAGGDRSERLAETAARYARAVDDAYRRDRARAGVQSLLVASDVIRSRRPDARAVVLGMYGGAPGETDGEVQFGSVLDGSGGVLDADPTGDPQLDRAFDALTGGVRNWEELRGLPGAVEDRRSGEVTVPLPVPEDGGPSVDEALFWEGVHGGHTDPLAAGDALCACGRRVFPEPDVDGLVFDLGGNSDDGYCAVLAAVSRDGRDDKQAASGMRARAVERIPDAVFDDTGWVCVPGGAPRADGKWVVPLR